MRTKEASPADEKDQDDFNDYETQGHLRTILEAHGIMSDPDKMAKVHALAGRHMSAIKDLNDVKAAYDRKYGSGTLKQMGKKAMQGQEPAEPAAPKPSTTAKPLGSGLGAFGKK